MTKALVLGGGGPIGISWEIGIAAGLRQAGVDIARADRIVGTSAGAVVGANLASGRSAADLFDSEVSRLGEAVTSGPAPDLQAFMAFLMRRPLDAYPSAASMARIGGFALNAVTFDEEVFVAKIAERLPRGRRAWPKGFTCTAVDAETGEFKAWDEACDVDLARAVASSCAVPGLYSPITIGGRRYVDGGIRSSTNVDVAAGCDEVLVVAVTMQMAVDRLSAPARRELGLLEARGARTALVLPNPDALAAFGPNLMDPTRGGDALVAGLRQGREEAGRLLAMSLDLAGSRQECD